MNINQKKTKTKGSLSVILDGYDCRGIAIKLNDEVATDVLPILILHDTKDKSMIQKIKVYVAGDEGKQTDNCDC